jgi:proline dehydrogenase
MLRQVILKASDNAWLRQHATHYEFLRRGVSRFMPGETLEEALGACRDLAGKGNLRGVVTRLGENVCDKAEAKEVTNHYLQALERISSSGLPVEISVKLTQLGLDLDFDFCLSNLTSLLEHAPADQTLWIDMEQSSYVDATLKLFHLAHRAFPRVGVCVQAYLYRTERYLDQLIAEGAAVRLVKGAYQESRELAFPKKRDVDQNYFRLAQILLGTEARGSGVRAVFATHDRKLINRLTAWAALQGLNRDDLEFQMLYGIQRAEQLNLAKSGYRAGVLVSYGPYWFPWFMRRLAERPANALFLVRNLIRG